MTCAISSFKFHLGTYCSGQDKMTKPLWESNYPKSNAERMRKVGIYWRNKGGSMGVAFDKRAEREGKKEFRQNITGRRRDTWRTKRGRPSKRKRQKEERKVTSSLAKINRTVCLEMKMKRPFGEWLKVRTRRGTYLLWQGAEAGHYGLSLMGIMWLLAPEWTPNLQVWTFLHHHIERPPRDPPPVHILFWSPPPPLPRTCHSLPAPPELLPRYSFLSLQFFYYSLFIWSTYLLLRKNKKFEKTVFLTTLIQQFNVFYSKFTGNYVSVTRLKVIRLQMRSNLVVWGAVSPI